MFNILVTGSDGQLGCEIKEKSVQFPDYGFIFHDIDTLDITNPDELESIFMDRSFDFVVNCAGYTKVDDAEKNRDLAFLVNGISAGNLARLSEKYSARLIHISTDFIFDGTKDEPYSEEEKPCPVSIYAKSKYEGEKAVLQHKNHIILRTSWLYSYYGSNFVKTMLKAGGEKESLRVVNDQVGSPTYASDLADVILHIISLTSAESKLYIPGIYHYSNEGICSWYDLAKETMRIAELSCSIIPVTTRDYPLPAQRPAYSVLATDKIKTTYKIHIPHWKESLAHCIKKIKHR